MEVILEYLLFALASAITGLYEVVWPVMDKLKIYSPNASVLQSRFISYPTFFFLMLLFAPITFVVVIIPSIGETFRSALLKSLV